MCGKKQKTITLYLIPWAMLLLGGGLGIWAGELAETFGAWFLLASALLFGLPHGACDFWILQQAVKDQKRSWVSLLSLFTVYLFLVLATAAIWYFAPALGLITFLALSIWHFGSGDAVWESQNQIDWLLNSLGRGLLLISAPLAFHRNASSLAMRGLIGNTDGSVRTAEVLLQFAPALLLLGIVLLLIGCRRRLLSLFLLENTFLLFFFWLTSPLLAVTCYLIGVHSWRHLLRLNIYETVEKPWRLSEIWLLIGKYHHRALPFTLLSLIGSAAILLIWQIHPAHLLEWTSAYLVMLSALTVPHALLISWTEIRRQNSLIRFC